jgi:hypothetical protein
MGPVEVLMKRTWLACDFERLGDLIHDHPVAFIIFPVEPINRVLEEHVRQ